MEHAKEKKYTILISTNKGMEEPIRSSVAKWENSKSISSVQCIIGSEEQIVNGVNAVVSEKNLTGESPLDIILLEKLADIEDAEILISIIKNISDTCKKNNLKELNTCAYLFLPDNQLDITDFENKNVYTALQRIERNNAYEGSLYNNTVLVSGDDDKKIKQVIDGIAFLTANDSGNDDHNRLYSEWRQLRQQYLNSKEILSAGLVKSTIYPEDTHAYNSCGYAVARFSEEAILTEILPGIQQALFDENGGGWLKKSNTLDDKYIEKELIRILNLDEGNSLDINVFWKNNLLGPINRFVSLNESNAHLTRKDINTKNTATFVESFNIGNKVEEAIKYVENLLKELITDILEKSAQTLFDFGPNALTSVFEGQNTVSIMSLKKVFEQGVTAFEEMLGKKVKRPVQQIVGVSGAEEQARITLWEQHFKRALESEICQKIANHFLANDIWNQMVNVPLERYAKLCKKMSGQLENISFNSNADIPVPYVVDLGNNRNLYEWIKEQIIVDIRKNKSAELKQHLIKVLQSEKQATSDNTNLIASYVRLLIGEKASLTDYFDALYKEKSVEEMEIELNSFIKEYHGLLQKSTPLLKVNTKEQHIKKMVVVPEKIATGNYGQLFMQLLNSNLALWGESDNVEVINTGANHSIACYQIGMVNPLYEIEGLTSWENSYNKMVGDQIINDWKNYFPLDLPNAEQNSVEKKFKESVFDECIEYALSENIIERNIIQGNGGQYSYDANLILNGWQNFNFSNYRNCGADGKAIKGAPLFDYLNNLNMGSANSEKLYRQEIVLPYPCIFSKPYDFSDLSDELDVDSISISYLKRILRKNMPLFVAIYNTVEKYKGFVDEVNKIYYKPVAGTSNATGTNSAVGTTKFCRYCGNPLKNSTARFCSKCGRQLS